MRIGSHCGRLALLEDDLALDVEEASGGRFSAQPAHAYARWTELRGWAATVGVASHPHAVPFSPDQLGAPSPEPRQIFAIGLNYRDHARETGLPEPEEPMVFTKFPSSVAGPDTDVRLPGDTVDWEVELVVVIGSGGRDISPADAPSRIAGYTAGQDLSERRVQLQSSPPQFGLGKSFAGFAPTGPAVVTLDEFDDADALRLRSTIVGADGSETVVQDGTTANLIFPVADLVSRLSRVVALLPGDLIFTGTPAGVGMGMSPPRFLVAGETLHTDIEGIGRITQRF